MRAPIKEAVKTFCTWYEVLASGEGIADSSAVATLDEAKGAVRRFQALYPQAQLIFVRQHFRRSSRFRVLHELTVKAGSRELTAEWKVRP